MRATSGGDAKTEAFVAGVARSHGEHLPGVGARRARDLGR